ncbi:MAG TPA: CoA ester lyase [Aquamicrobium sp.]|nr:CoA ester lyase [Aquamicrobium sp.]
MTQSARRRSVLYVPATNVKAMAKTASLPCDAVIFDLEDAVAPEARPAARENLLARFAEVPASPGQERIIRVSLSAGGVDADDVALVGRCCPDAMLVPKVDSADMLREARAALDARGGQGIALWAMIETPRAIVRLRDITECDDVGLACLVACTNDLSKETGVPLPEGRATIAQWLAMLVVHARAAGIDVLDGVYNDFADMEGFVAECRAGALAGFDGKTLIHPRQIDDANAVFSPSAEAIAQARAIVAAFARPENAGKGVISVDGRMVELLHLDIARRTLAKAG